MVYLSPRNEQRLRDLVATGRYRSEDEVVTAALQALRVKLLIEHEANLAAGSRNLSLEKCLKAFDAWSPCTRSNNRLMDDSRESIC
ncbi:hypothetical protein [Aeoliella sp. SH292]|uniref:hypothetical protein n=1 Tax=Aeoliella sp. SH292 TaxID=3454464 RepID=UPI003F9CCB23